MIYVGIDDTDVVGSAGTNQLARAIVARLGRLAEGAVICRHQLLFDRRVPYTSKNGSASIALPQAQTPGALIGPVREVMRAWYVEGSDPGLCVAPTVADALRAFGRRCQQQLVVQEDARACAARAGVHLEGLGGTEQGVVGALAAVGLAATGEDGRVVQLRAWAYPDGFCGPQTPADIRARGVDDIRRFDTGAPVAAGLIDVGKHLRPNVRDGRIVLFVRPVEESAARTVWQAVKLT